MANKHIVLSCDSVYMKKSYRDDQKSLLRNSLVNCQFIENKHGGEKQIYLQFLSANSITYTLIKRNLQTKQNEFFIKRMTVCFKRIKKIAELSLSEHTRKQEIYFASSLPFLCVNFTAINKECLNKNLVLKILQYSPENTCVVSFFIKLQDFSLQD